MPLLQVRDFPEDIYAEVAFGAHAQHRTIAQQIIVLVQKGLGEEESNRERVKRTLAEIKAQAIPPEAKAVDFKKLIREDRDR
ncbi:MAG: hypothetical protein LBN21_00740 [Treponema sp.]|nr:hypothetical protein [Treponema sp.]